MTSKALLASVAAGALCCMGAYADDSAISPGPTTSALTATPQWEGFYLGFTAGYDWGLVHVTDVDSYNGPPQIRYEPDGGNFAVHLGYNWVPFENVVVGVEGELGYYGMDGSQQYPPYIGVRSATDSVASIEGGLFLSGAVRVGYAFDNFLLYAKVGGAGVGMETKYIDDDPNGTTLVSGTSVRGMSGGVTFGAGVEYWFAEGWSARAEYDRYDFGIMTHTAKSAGGSTWVFRHAVLANAVKFGISYHF